MSKLCLLYAPVVTSHIYEDAFKVTSQTVVLCLNETPQHTL